MTDRDKEKNRKTEETEMTETRQTTTQLEAERLLAMYIKAYHVEDVSTIDTARAINQLLRWIEYKRKNEIQLDTDSEVTVMSLSLDSPHWDIIDAYETLQQYYIDNLYQQIFADNMDQAERDARR